METKSCPWEEEREAGVMNDISCHMGWAYSAFLDSSLEQRVSGDIHSRFLMLYVWSESSYTICRET